MPAALDSLLRDRGTRFLLYPQLPGTAAGRAPEVVWVSPRAGTVAPGPADRRMYTVDPVDKAPYDEHSAPPYAGAVHPPAEPDSEGHFDAIPIDSRAFLSAHMYGTVRRVMDIWEHYLAAPIALPFSDSLELVPLVDWANAHAGPGYIETGYEIGYDGSTSLFCLNLDVLAHEVGHMILFSEVGLPDPDAMTAEFRGFHEAFADIVALVSGLHFDGFVDHLLSTTHGNLYALNELNRIGELSSTDQIRLASNAKRMSHVPPAGTPVDELSQRELHEMSQPLTGALFDLFVEVFEQRLLDSGAIDPALDALTRRDEEALDLERIQAGYDVAHQAAPAAFREALVEARDYLGALVAGAARSLGPHFLDYVVVASALLREDETLTGGRHADAIIECIHWREIGDG